MDPFRRRALGLMLAITLPAATGLPAAGALAEERWSAGAAADTHGPARDATRTQADRLADFDRRRKSLWATKFARETFGVTNQWDVEYDGRDSAADHVPEHLKWDSVVDDDWHTPYGFKFNTPSPGILTVDRITEPARYDKTGNIWIRDPALTSRHGVTIELRLRIPHASHDQYMQRDAVSLIYQDDAGSFGLHFSPRMVRAGAIDPKLPYDWVSREYDFARELQVVRIYQFPGDDNFYWYIGKTGPFAGHVDRTAAHRAKWDGSHSGYPRILFGDNSNAISVNGIFELDYIRYRRGVVPLGRVAAAPPPRPIPLMPPHETPRTRARWTTVRNAHDLAALFRVRSGSVVDTGDGILFDGRAAPALVRSAADYTTSLKGLPTGGSFTIELVAKVLDGTDESGFVVEHFDRIGGTTLGLSPGKVTLLHGADPTGQTAVPMSTTDGFHTYRLVRHCPEPKWASCLYSHLYVDGDPVPAVADRHIDGTLLTGSRLSLGDLGYPIAESRARVLVKSIRWTSTALAPMRDTPVAETAPEPSPRQRRRRHHRREGGRASDTVPFRGYANDWIDPVRDPG